MLSINAYSHGCCIKATTLEERRAINAYIKNNLYQTDKIFDNRTKTYNVEHKATFAAAKGDRSEYRIMRSDLEPFLSFVEFMGVKRYNMDIVYRETTPGDDIDLDMRPEYTPRDDDQVDAIAFTLMPNASNRVLHARTGFGKTFCGFYAACAIKKRTALIMEPTHIGTWLKDAEDYATITKEEMIIVKGSAALKAVMEHRRIGALDAKFIFFSAATIRNYIKEYESQDEIFSYPVPPDELMEYLGIGFCIRDESHESIHSLCRQSMYTNVSRILYLSATLVSDDKFINRMYEKIFPVKDRWESKPNKHIEYYSVFYKTAPSAKIKFKGPRGYSHITYEKSILANASLREEHWQMIKELIDDSYADNKLDGQKLIMFCSTKKMCGYLAERASVDYPQFTVGCYIGGSKDEELYERDVVFSTPKSAGTGKDIKDLAVAWNTVALGSTQLHRQIAGRLRELKNYPGEFPKFYMLYNESIPQHIGYERNKKIDALGRCRSYKKVHLRRVLGVKSANGVFKNRRNKGKRGW